MYYQKGEIVYAEYIEKQKKKNGSVFKVYFYFQNGSLLYKTTQPKLKFDLEQVLKEEKMIRAYFGKP